MNLAAEGVGISVIARVLGHCEETIARWLERTGRQASLLHDLYFHDLPLLYVQVDELQTKIRRWSHLKPDERAWLWAAIDPRTKIIPVLYLGGRVTVDAMLFIHELVARLAEGCVPLFTSDGLRQYYWALTAHFGSWLLPPFRSFSAMVEATVWQRLFDGRFEDRGYAISVFEAHVEEVKRTVPPENLLICDVSEGWEPLCAFLGVPVPPGDFPHANNRKSTQRLFLLARVAPIIVGAGLAGLLIWLGNRIF